jgi:hypothetical protein
MRRPKGLDASAANQLLGAFALISSALKDQASFWLTARHR